MGLLEDIKKYDVWIIIIFIALVVVGYNVTVYWEAIKNAFFGLSGGIQGYLESSEHF